MSELNEENPWDIQSLYELLYFICPSCTYIHNSKEEFICHAYEIHPESEKYLKNIKDGSMDLDLKPDLDIDLPSFNGVEFDIEEIHHGDDKKNFKSDSQKFNTKNPVVVIKPFKTEDYNCEFCNTFYHSQDLLTSHYKTIHGVKEEENLETNLDLIENNTTTLMTSTDLKKEEIMDYDDENELNDSNIEYENEISKDSGDSKGFLGKRVNCPQCQKEMHKNSLSKHLKEIHNYQSDYQNELNDVTNIGLIKCNQCSLTFENETLIKEHVLIDHKDGRKNVHTFKCDACDNQSFDSKKALILHYNDKHEDLQRFECKYCHLKFGTSGKLQGHTRYHHEKDKAYDCETCGKSFARQKSLKIHISRAHEGCPDYKCEICHKRFLRRPMIKIHMMKFHKGQKKHKCDKCGKSFYQDWEVKRHVRAYHEGGHKCETCGKYFASKGQLEGHVSRIHEGGTKNYHCDQCSQSFYTKDRLQNHIDKFHSEACIHKCEICDLSYRTRHMLYDHIYTQHEGRTKNYKCEKCDKAFRLKIFLDKHLDFNCERQEKYCEQCKLWIKSKKWSNHVRMEHVVDTEIPCDKCGKMFPTQLKLNSHVKIVHDNYRKESCPVCGVMRPKGIALKNHIRTVHEKIRDFQCLLCGQTFGQKSSLQKHEVYHTGIKKFECFCGKVFATQNYLHRHKNSVHEKPKYKCQYCEKWFHTPERLKRHVDPIHLGIKKYKCSLCTNAYGQSVELRKHLINFHKQTITGPVRMYVSPNVAVGGTRVSQSKNLAKDDE